jgi:antitoxin MazE
MQSTHLHLDEDVDVCEEKGRILIEPVRRKSDRLEDLVKAIDAKSLADQADFGQPAGREVWYVPGT